MTDTDPVPPEDEGGQYRYPLLARLFGVDVHAQQTADAFTVPLEEEPVLNEALASLRETVTSLDNIAK